MKIKKFLAILMAVCLCVSVLALAGCSSDSGDSSAKNDASNDAAPSDSSTDNDASSASDAEDGDAEDGEAVSEPKRGTSDTVKGDEDSDYNTADTDVEYKFGKIEKIADSVWTVKLYDAGDNDNFADIMVKDNLTDSTEDVDTSAISNVYVRDDENDTWTEGELSAAQKGDGVIVTTEANGTQAIWIVAK